MKRLLLAGIGSLLIAAGAMAQVRNSAIGGKVGLYFDGGRPLFGVIGEVPLTRELDFEPGTELVFGIPNTTLLVVDANGRYSFDLVGSEVRPYVLGGLGLSFAFVSVGGTSSSTSDFRLNLGGGAVFNSRSLVQYWAGLKLYLLAKAGSDVSLQGGVNFYIF